MSVTSVLADRPTPYRPISATSAPGAKFAPTAKQSGGSPPIQPVEAGYADPADVSQYQSALEQALRADGATAANSTSGASESQGGQSSAGIALYKRVSQIGNSEPSASELLKSWNSIMQSGQDGDDAGAATLKAFLQSGASAPGSSILDVTA
jgi:hypothetical protein